MDDEATSEFSNRSRTILTQLENFEPHDERETESLARIRKLLINSNQDEALDRDLSLHHLTGSAFMISEAGLLLHLHKKIQLWIQPGGHLDRGESPFEAAKRESFEETGIAAKFEQEIFHLDVHETPNGHVHYDFRYLAYCENVAPNPGENESQDVKFFSERECQNIDDPALKGAIQKLINKGKFIEPGNFKVKS